MRDDDGEGFRIAMVIVAFIGFVALAASLVSLVMP
jgi:hypothetical protein